MRATLLVTVIAALVSFPSPASTSDTASRPSVRARDPAKVRLPRATPPNLEHNVPRAKPSNSWQDRRSYLSWPEQDKRDHVPRAKPSSQVRRDHAPRAKPSSIAGRRDYGGNHNIKRSLQDQNVLGNENKDGLVYDTDQCPAPLSACPVRGAPDGDAFECVDLLSDLDSCGGCTADDPLYDCNTVPNARGVECVSGFCKVHSCSEGYVVATSRDGCVRVRSR